MRIQEWDARYRSREKTEDLSSEPTPLVIETARKLTPATALDVACGTGRNAMFLAEHGWHVTAVDGAAAAIEILNARARERGLDIRTQVADLEKSELAIEPNSWDLVMKCYYLQRSLIPAVKAGLQPGGVAIVIVHVAPPEEELMRKHASPGELQNFFADWEILHYYEGQPNDAAHKRSVAEVVARKPQEKRISRS